MATYHWIITCRCGDPVEHFCKNCSNKLCSNCKVKHLENEETKHHEVVSYVEKPIVIQMARLLCSKHVDKECIYWCEKCIYPACMICVTSTHKGHDLTDIEIIIKEKIKTAQNKLQKLESNSLEWGSHLEGATKITSEYDNQVETIKNKLEDRAEEFHNKINEILDHSKKQLAEMQAELRTILQKQVQNASDGLEKVKQEIKDCEDTLREGDVKKLLQYETENGEENNNLPPELSQFMPPDFTTGTIDTKSLTVMFGDVCQNKAVSPPPPQIPPISPVDSGFASELKELIPKPSISATFDAGHYCPSVVCVSSDRAWIKTGNQQLQLVDSEGISKDTIDTDFRFGGLVLSNKGELLMSDADNKCIRSISPDKEVQTLFYTQFTPWGLCFLQSGDIAVTFFNESRIIIYSKSGDISQELDKKLFKLPYRIAQSKVNGDLYIIDRKATNLSEPGKLIVLDASYKLRFRYSGTFIFKEPCLLDLCTDSIGHILVTDHVNHRVHILDKDGKFLHDLLTQKEGLYLPYTIDVDNQGNAWVGGSGHSANDGKVYLVKYLQKKIPTASLTQTI